MSNYIIIKNYSIFSAVFVINAMKLNIKAQYAVPCKYESPILPDFDALGYGIVLVNIPL